MREIERTKQRTAEVLHARKAHEEKMKKRIDERQRDEYGKRRDAAMLALQKEEQLRTIWARRQAELSTRRAAAADVRKEREINRCRALLAREEVKEKAAEARKEVREKKAEAKSKRVDAEKTRMATVHDAYAARISEDAAARAEREKLASQLVQVEAQLIYKLKRLHVEKQSAIRDLATAVECVRAEEHAAATAAPPPGEEEGGEPKEDKDDPTPRAAARLRAAKAHADATGDAD